MDGESPPQRPYAFRVTRGVRELHAKTRKALLLASLALVSGAVARAQQMDAIGALLQRSDAQGVADAPVDSGQQTVRQPLSPSDFANFRQAVEAARRGDVNTARAAPATIIDRSAKKAATWVLADSAGDMLSFYEADQARREWRAWPRAVGRQAAAEK